MRTFLSLSLALAIACLGLLAERPLYAAVSQNLVVTTQTPLLSTTYFVQGTDSAGTYKTIKTGGTNGSKIVAIIVSTSDATAASHVINVQLSSSTSSHCSPNNLSCSPGAAVTMILGAGFSAGVPAVNLMSPTNWPGLPIDSDGNPYILLTGSSQTIEATFATALTASTVIAFTVISADF